MKKQIEQKLRSLLIHRWAAVSNWVGKHITYADPDHPIGWRDHLRWRLETWLDPIFGFAYSGSDEELEDALNGDTPYEYLNERQIAFLRDHAYAGAKPDFSLLALPSAPSAPSVVKR